MYIIIARTRIALTYCTAENFHWTKILPNYTHLTCTTCTLAVLHTTNPYTHTIAKDRHRLYVHVQCNH